MWGDGGLAPPECGGTTGRYPRVLDAIQKRLPAYVVHYPVRPERRLPRSLDVYGRHGEPHACNQTQRAEASYRITLQRARATHQRDPENVALAEYDRILGLCTDRNSELEVAAASAVIAAGQIFLFGLSLGYPGTGAVAGIVGASSLSASALACLWSGRAAAWAAVRYPQGRSGGHRLGGD
jgi:hypothetical protein